MANEHRQWETRPDGGLQQAAWPFTEELRAALDRLRAGTKCEECHWQEATKVIGRRRCLCETCGTLASGHARFMRAVERRHGRA
jgi:hypothetical protein